MGRKSGLGLPNLRLARFNRGWTIEKLVEKSGVSRTTIMRLEGGKGRTSPSTSLKLATALGANVWMLESVEGSDLHGQVTGE